MKKLTAEERAAKRAALQKETEATIKASEEKPKRKKSSVADEAKPEEKNNDVEDKEESNAVESSEVASDGAAESEQEAE